MVTWALVKHGLVRTPVRSLAHAAPRHPLLEDVPTTVIVHRIFAGCVPVSVWVLEVFGGYGFPKVSVPWITVMAKRVAF